MHQQRPQHLEQRLLGLTGRETAVEPENPPRRGVTERDDLGEPPLARGTVHVTPQRLRERLATPPQVIRTAARRQLRYAGRLMCLGVQLQDQGAPKDAATAAALAPHAEAVTIRAARTLIPLEQPAALAARIRQFWDTTVEYAGETDASRTRRAQDDDNSP